MVRGIFAEVNVVIAVVDVQVLGCQRSWHGYDWPQCLLVGLTVVVWQLGALISPKVVVLVMVCMAFKWLGGSSWWRRWGDSWHSGFEHHTYGRSGPEGI